MGGTSEPRPASVLLLGTDLSTGGGVNRVICDLAEIFADGLGLEVTVASARSQRAPTYPLPSNVRFLQGRSKGLLDYLRFFWQVRKGRYDFVVSFWAQDNILALMMLIGSGVRVIACEHDSFFNTAIHVRLLRRLTYRFAHQVTVLNRRELQHYETFLRNVSLVPNPVVTPRAVRKEEPPNVVLAIGHLIARKGFDMLIEAIAASGITQRGWRVRIVGSGPEKDRLETIIADREIPNTVIVPPSDRIANEYGSARIIVVPSRVEVFSLVLAEGVLAGLTPLAFDSDGPAYLLEQHSQFLVPLGDVKALARRLSSLCEDFDADGPSTRDLSARLSKLTDPAAIKQIWRGLLAEKRPLYRPSGAIEQPSGRQSDR